MQSYVNPAVTGLHQLDLFSSPDKQIMMLPQGSKAGEQSLAITNYHAFCSGWKVFLLQLQKSLQSLEHYCKTRPFLPLSDPLFLYFSTPADPE